MSFIGTIVASCVFSANAGPQWVLETAPVRSIEAVLTYEIEAPGLSAEEWVAFVAKPPELAGQRDVSLRTSPEGKDLNELSSLARPLVFIRESSRQTKRRNRFTVTAAYKMKLQARTLKPVAEARSITPVATLSEAERQQATQNTEYFDFASAELALWMKENDLFRNDGESDIDLARRVFNAINVEFKYEYRPDLDRRASVVCQSKKSDCGGLSTLFTAALRANGVPARVLVGRWAHSANDGQKLGGVPYFQTHVKAEFFADAVGWVPVDPASAVLHDRSGDHSRYFGNDPGDFITMHIDPEITVDTIHFGKKQTPWMQGVTFWVTGQGSLAKMKTHESWTVKRAN